MKGTQQELGTLRKHDADGKENGIISIISGVSTAIIWQVEV